MPLGQRQRWGRSGRGGLGRGGAASIAGRAPGSSCWRCWRRHCCCCCCWRCCWRRRCCCCWRRCWRLCQGEVPPDPLDQVLACWAGKREACVAGRCRHRRLPRHADCGQGGGRRDQVIGALPTHRVQGTSPGQRVSPDDAQWKGRQGPCPGEMDSRISTMGALTPGRHHTLEGRRGAARLARVAVAAQVEVWQHAALEPRAHDRAAPAAVALHSHVHLHGCRRLARPVAGGCCIARLAGGRSRGRRGVKVDDLSLKPEVAQQRSGFSGAHPLAAGLDAVPQLLGTGSVEARRPRTLDPGLQRWDVGYDAGAPKQLGRCLLQAQAAACGRRSTPAQFELTGCVPPSRTRCPACTRLRRTPCGCRTTHRAGRQDVGDQHLHVAPAAAPARVVALHREVLHRTTEESTVRRGAGPAARRLAVGAWLAALPQAERD